MGIVDKERLVKDLLRSLEGCATGATQHRLAQVRHVLLNAFAFYKEDPDNPGHCILLDEATRNALGELAAAVWSRRYPCG